jgi:hypothetical protein
MKKLIPFFIFLLILSGCSEWKYGRGVRPSKNEVRYSEVIIEKNKAEPLVIQVPNIEINDLAVLEKAAVRQEPIESKIKIDKKELEDFTWTPSQDQAVENLDSLKKQEEIVRQAIQNERTGRNSSILGIIGTVLSFTPLFIAGFVLGIIGLKSSSTALKAQYITPKGLNLARVGSAFSIVAIVLSSLIILLVLLALLFIVFGF